MQIVFWDCAHFDEQRMISPERSGLVLNIDIIYGCNLLNCILS